MGELAEGDSREIVTLLRELVKWSRFESIPRLRTVLEQNLPSDKEKIIYESSDGEHSTWDIAKIASVSAQTVSNYWKKWSKLRIVEKAGTREGRSKRICSLEEVGIEVPAPKGAATLPLSEQEGKENQEVGNDVSGQ